MFNVIDTTSEDIANPNYKEKDDEIIDIESGIEIEERMDISKEE